MQRVSRVLSLDSNVLIAALKSDEPYSERCAEILKLVPDDFILSEPAVVYQEVCGTLARRAGLRVAKKAKEQLDKIIQRRFVANCGRAFCVGAYPLCSDYGIYAIDAMYLKVALDHQGVLVSLDREDFVDRVNSKKPGIEVYHVSDFPYAR